MRRTLLATLSLALFALPARAEDLYITAGKVIVGDGREIAPATILVRDGKIQALAVKTIPPGARHLDFSPATIIPGLVAASSRISIAGAANEESSEITPTFEIAGALDEKSKDHRRAAELGLTTACVRPGLANVIGGRCAVIRPGASPFLVRRQQDLLIPVGPWPASGNTSPGWAGINYAKARRPTTRLATVWLIRKSFLDARQYMRTGSLAGLAKEAPGAYRKEELETLAQALRGEIVVRFYAQADKDVRTVYRLAQELGIPRFRIEGLLEGYRGPKELGHLADGLVVEITDPDPLVSDQAVAPILPLPAQQLVEWLRTGHVHADGCGICGSAGGSEDAGAERPQHGARANNVALLLEQNPLVALSSDEDVPDLLDAASWAVRHGADRKKALAAITTNPARMLGLEKEVGTLAPGMRADLVVVSGDPFEFTTRIVAVLSGGRQVHPPAGK